MKNSAEQFQSKLVANKNDNQKPVWFHGYKSKSIVPIIKLIFQGILLILGIGAALQFVWQLLSIVP